jgi:hypothetical protein
MEEINVSSFKLPGAITVPLSGDGYGYVYVMSYPNSKHVKIGHALHPNSRASEIGGTLAPEKPIVEACIWCAERRQDVERSAHKLEAGSRGNGEWFDLTIERAMAAIIRAASGLNIQTLLVYDRNAVDLKEKKQALAAKAANELKAHKLALQELEKIQNEANKKRIFEKEGGFKSEVQHLPPSKVSRCKAAHPSAINNSSLRIV